ncbi:hemK [Wigglesworthia glossinidia endosymbiont of Glossina brevipalpis]|uniref:peptide chain release factor N(5)-glutamine methyltransferase n=1 Tax=Wigglesworthia glossinidia brevipalpis TaxID=36870 RepID=Q8D2L0_WIGBR|nr:hemK [Wigglesworthia glossinidia endosymbiont of Glossina brevipalpis]
MKYISWNEWMYESAKILNITNNYCSIKESELLLKHVLRVDSKKIILHGENYLTKNQYYKLKNLLIRRKLGEPISYLIKSHEFWSIKIKISCGIFIPRHDTECLIETALSLPLKKESRILELGSGSGVISLSLGKENPKWIITGIDKNKKSIFLSRKNAKMLNINNVKFKKINWKYLKDKKIYSMIITNPPYIKKNDPCLLKGDLKFEPKSALISGRDGLKDIKIICKISKKFLKRKGYLLVEHGFQQGEDVRNLFLSNGYKSVCTCFDYTRKERVTYGILN